MIWRLLSTFLRRKTRSNNIKKNIINLAMSLENKQNTWTNRRFTKEDKHMKRSSMCLAIREMQTKTTVSYYY